MLGECVISSVLSHHSNNLKWWTSVTTWLQLSFVRQAKENTSSRCEGRLTQKKRGAQFWLLLFFFFYFYFFYLWWILSCIEMKQPRVYMCSPSQSPLPPPSPPIPSRFSQCTKSERFPLKASHLPKFLFINMPIQIHLQF